MKRALAAALLIAAVLGNAADVSAAPSRQVRRWIEDVILGPEYGGEGAICSRWTKTPTLSVFGGTRAHHALIRRVVGELNVTLAQTPLRRIDLVEPEDDDADIRVFFTTIAEMPQLAEDNGFTYVAGNLGYFWTFWNGRHEITDAVILLSTDAKYREYLPHYALEEVTQALGLSGDSAELEDSIFSSHPEADDPWVQHLSALDRKLIVFFYTRIRPGDTPSEVRRALASHWK